MSSNGLPRVRPVENYVAKPDEHVSLVIRELGQYRLIWVRAMKATIDFMGWGREFNTEIQHKSARSADGLVQLTKKGHNSLVHGKKMVIYRGRNRHRPGPQNRHGFRIATHATLLDVAELAHFTTCDWHWMSSPNGVLRSREEWDAIYQAGGKAPLR
jgi:hypothetical protein